MPRPATGAVVTTKAGGFALRFTAYGERHAAAPPRCCHRTRAPSRGGYPAPPPAARSGSHGERFMGALDNLRCIGSPGRKARHTPPTATHPAAFLLCHRSAAESPGGGSSTRGEGPFFR